MRFSIITVSSTLLAFLTSLPSVTAQAMDGPIVPFAQLPACAALCGPLYDVQGACTPPVTTAPDQSCFCNDAKLKPFGSNGAGVCDAACAADPAGLSSIATWYQGFCGAAQQPAPGNPQQPGQPGTGTGGGAATTTLPDGTVVTQTPVPAKPADGAPKKKQTWIEEHYPYIIMIVILVVAIVVGWILAAYFRKRYLKKRELNFELRPPHQPWVGASDNTNPYSGNGGGGQGWGKDGTEVKVKRGWFSRS